MKIVAFVNILGLGGTEKAACRWAQGLKECGHAVTMLTLIDGPRRTELEERRIPVRVVPAESAKVAATLRECAPEIIHTHAPGHPQMGDVLGEALATMPKIPVVQSNVFGHLMNPKEDSWTDFRLFISWTSCVQAAQRVGRRLDESFFRRASVAVYPVDPLAPASQADIIAFRKRLGVVEGEVLFGRLSRPDPSKWTELAVKAFQIAMRRDRTIKLLLREPPKTVAERLRASPNANRFIILPATSDPSELQLTMSALDVVLHTSLIGESFGYGIAEPMNLGKPVISHSVPWADQAQIELVRHNECGFVASTPRTMANAILRLAESSTLRQEMGAEGQRNVREIANAQTSIRRLASVLEAVRSGRDNPFAGPDLAKAHTTEAYLSREQFGHSLADQMVLRSGYWRARFYHWRKAFGFARALRHC
jgi:glycosyltransferase involved in cell wall biosynthesis